MNPQWQQQQQQMRRQQEQMREQQRRQQQMAVWYKQQEQKKAQQQPQAMVGDRFAQVEAEAVRLRQEFAIGRLSKEQFRARLQELMVQDEQGAWWTVGHETGGWYRYDGANWVRDDPPGYSGVGAALQFGAPPVAPTKPKKSLARLAAEFLVGLVFVFFFGLFAGRFGGPYDFSVTILFWLIGLIALIAAVRRQK